MKFPPLRLRAALSLGGLSVRKLLTRTWEEVIKNELMTRAAAVSYYALLALVPFLALILTLAVFALPDVTIDLGGGETGVDNRAVHELRSSLQRYFPDEAAELMVTQISRIQANPPTSLLSFGVLVTVWLASSLFVAVIDAMNAVYGVEETRPIWKLRLTAIAMTVVQAVILVGSLLLIAAWGPIIRWLGLGELAATLATGLRWAVILVAVLLSFALSFYVAPDADQRWEWITPGSIAGTILFLLVTYLFGIYVRNFGNYDQTYGSLGGVMILLFWFWVSSLILLAAGQMNKVIEDASPLGKNQGQKHDATRVPDFAAIAPEPSDRPG